MKKLLFLLPLFFIGCITQDPIVRSPRYFNTEVDIVDYHATPFNTEWVLKAQPGETMRLVFNYETIEIDFIEDKDKLGEYIFTVKSQTHE